MEEFKKHQYRTQSLKNYLRVSLNSAKGSLVLQALVPCSLLKYLAVENKVL